jgi:hypothetical protein
MLTLKIGGKPITQTLLALPATTLATLVQSHVEKTDNDAYTSLGLFLYYDAEGSQKLAFNRIEGMPKVETRLIDEITRQQLHRAELEFARENQPGGVVLLKSILDSYPASPAGIAAKKLEQQLYQLTTWSEVGNRTWKRDEKIAQFEAAPERVENSYLQSPKTYKSFDLQLEWKTIGRVGQGGIYFHYAGQGPVFNKAYKIPFANDFEVAPDAYCTGALFGLEAPTKNAVKQNGEWNTSRLIVQGGSIKFMLNGQTVLETFALSEELPEEGFVLLDGVTGGIVYRHILFTELP